jgi:hypothetical protein
MLDYDPLITNKNQEHIKVTQEPVSFCTYSSIWLRTYKIVPKSKLESSVSCECTVTSYISRRSIHIFNEEKPLALRTCILPLVKNF